MQWHSSCCIGVPRFGIRDERAVVRIVHDTIVVGVGITSIPYVVAISIFLSGIQDFRAVVGLASLIGTKESEVRPSINVLIRSAHLAITGEAYFAPALKSVRKRRNMETSSPG